jgi:hypothetical protein
MVQTTRMDPDRTLAAGSVRVTRCDPFGHGAPIVEQGPGEFVAEVGQLSGQPALVDVHAIDNVEALLIPPENLRALMIERWSSAKRSCARSSCVASPWSRLALWPGPDRT